LQFAFCPDRRHSSRRHRPIEEARFADLLICCKIFKCSAEKQRLNACHSLISIQHLTQSPIEVWQAIQAKSGLICEDRVSAVASMHKQRMMQRAAMTSDPSVGRHHSTQSVSKTALAQPHRWLVHKSASGQRRRRHRPLTLTASAAASSGSSVHVLSDGTAIEFYKEQPTAGVRVTCVNNVKLEQCIPPAAPASKSRCHQLLSTCCWGWTPRRTPAGHSLRSPYATHGPVQWVPPGDWKPIS
jgi:hypothetical protein